MFQDIELNAFRELSHELRMNEKMLQDAIGDQWALQRNLTAGELLFMRPVFEGGSSDTDAIFGRDLIFDIGIKVNFLGEVEVGPLYGSWGTGGERTYSIPKVVATVHLGDKLPFELANAVGRAEQLWESKLKACKFCKVKFSPDELYEKNCCYGCASEHLGVVF
jgi:hypothetical protein